MPKTKKSRRKKTEYKILGLVILPGLQWSKYLVEDAKGNHRLLYEHEVMDLCRDERVTNGTVIVREKRAYDDWDAGAELHVFPPNLLDTNYVRVTTEAWVDDRDKAVRDATKQLIRIASSRD